MIERGHGTGNPCKVEDRRRPARLRAVSVSFVALAAGAVLTGCNTSSESNKYGVTASPRVVKPGTPVPSGGGYYKVGRPYKIAGRWYHPKEDPGYDKVGLASWYGSAFHGRKTANGEVFDMTALTAAHPTLPLPTYARVTNLENGNSVIVRVNDRGPFAHNRLIDLSKRTADVLGFKHRGTAKVRVQYVGMAPIDGNDGQWLTTTVRTDGQPVGPVMMASLTPQMGAAGNAPPPPPQGTPAPNSQTTFGYQPLSQSLPKEIAPVGPVPREPVGTGNVTYRWVTGYAELQTVRPDNPVAAAFSLFETDQPIVLVVRTGDFGADRPFDRR